MSSLPVNGKVSKAEARFRAAFDRLKAGKPEVLPKGSRVTQNNVAKEAGLDPSALRRQRYPDFVEEIQAWIKKHQGDDAVKTVRQEALDTRRRRRSLTTILKDRTNERDAALSKLLDAQRYILELRVQMAKLTGDLPKDSSVIPLRSPRKRQY